MSAVGWRVFRLLIPASENRINCWLELVICITGDEAAA